MSDVMLFGVLRMPYDMAMHSELSRKQFYNRAQQAADKIERLTDQLNSMIKGHRKEFERAESLLAENSELTESNTILEHRLADCHRWKDVLTAEVSRKTEALNDICDILDKHLGDTDPNWPPEWTDEEIKEEMPVFWCCRRAAIAARPPVSGSPKCTNPNCIDGYFPSQPDGEPEPCPDCTDLSND